MADSHYDSTIPSSERVVAGLLDRPQEHAYTLDILPSYVHTSKNAHVTANNTWNMLLRRIYLRIFDCGVAN